MKEFKVMRSRRHRRSYSYYSTHWTTAKRTVDIKRILLIALAVVISLVTVFSVYTLCTVDLFSSVDSDADVVPCVIENEQVARLTIKNGDMRIISVDVDEDQFDNVEFSSDNTDVLTVDAGGRIDAKSEGEATVTAQCRDFFGQCVVTVNKSQKQSSDEYTSAIVANTEILDKNKKDGSKNPYKIQVNRNTNTVTVFTYDDRGKYTVPVRAMICSCGEMTPENITPTGTYSVYLKSRWHALFSDVYGQYITGFSGHYLFHSVPYTDTSEDTLKTDEFNKLGTNASQGCVRMLVSDAKWIYDNCDYETEVEVIDKKESADPLSRPEVIKLDGSIRWDPTDPAKKNPYKDMLPVIKGAKKQTVNKGEAFDMLKGITAIDSCGNDITDTIEVIGNVVTTKEGKYKVTYKVTDTIGKEAEKTIVITVK